MSLHLQCLQSGRCYLGRAQRCQFWLPGISEKKYVSHIINILLTSSARSVWGKYGPLGLGSTDLTEAAWYCQDLSTHIFPAQSRANEANKIYIRATLSSKRQVKHILHGIDHTAKWLFTNFQKVTRDQGNSTTDEFTHLPILLFSVISERVLVSSIVCTCSR